MIKEFCGVSGGAVPGSLSAWWGGPGRTSSGCLQDRRSRRRGTRTGGCPRRWRPRPPAQGEMTVEIVHEDPGHVGDGSAFRPLARQPGYDQRAVAYPELDPVPPGIVIGQHARRLQAEHAGQPAGRDGRFGVRDGKPQRAVSSGGGGASPRRAHQAPNQAGATRTQNVPPRSAPPAGMLASTRTIVPPAVGSNRTSIMTSSTELCQHSRATCSHTVIRPNSSAAQVTSS